MREFEYEDGLGLIIALVCERKLTAAVVTTITDEMNSIGRKKTVCWLTSAGREKLTSTCRRISDWLVGGS